MSKCYDIEDKDKIIADLLEACKEIQELTNDITNEFGNKESVSLSLDRIRELNQIVTQAIEKAERKD